MKYIFLLLLIILCSACVNIAEKNNLIYDNYEVLPVWALLAEPHKFNGRKIAVSAYAKEASYRDFLMIYPTKDLADVDDFYSAITLLPQSGYRANPGLITDCGNRMVFVLGIFSYQPTIDNGKVILWHPEIYEIPYINELGSHEDDDSLTVCFEEESLINEIET